jgi:hypothetical protein
MTSTIGTTVLAATLALLPTIAGAAEDPRAEQHSQTLRSFVLRNRSDQTVTEAHAYTTQKKDMLLTARGEITPSHAQEFMIEQAECVDRVTAKLKNGHELKLDNMQDCRSPTIFVDNDRISVQSSATGSPPPGAPRGEKEKK